MKRLFGMLTVVLIACTLLPSCHSVSVEGGEEAVLIMKPWLFGSGGVVEQPVTDGLTWCVLSTSSEKFDVKPVQYSEAFADIITKDNNPVDFHSFIKIQIMEGKSPELYDRFGINWYVNNIQQPFRKNNRNLSSEQKLFDLTSDRRIVDSLENVMLTYMQNLVTELKMPVSVLDVHIGKVVPPATVLIETEKTAAQEQRILTLDATERAENARAASETARSNADNAYKNGMGYSNKEYLQHRDIEVRLEQLEIVKGKKAVKVIMNTGGVTAQPYVSAD